jgi:hypothetical protein
MCWLAPHEVFKVIFVRKALKVFFSVDADSDH